MAKKSSESVNDTPEDSESTTGAGATAAGPETTDGSGLAETDGRSEQAVASGAADGTKSREERLRELFLEGDLGRRLVHVAGAGFPAIYILPFIEWWHVTALMVLVTLGAVILEVLRLSVGLNWFIYEHLTREYEQDAPAAYLLYMISATAVAIVAEPRIAIPAILMLTVADPIAGVISRDELRTVKRPRALATMFGVCTLFALPFVPDNPLAAVLGGIGGMLADGVKPIVRGVVVDDDLTIAPAGAFGIWLGLELSAMLL
jgi:dolichol kinase